MILRILLILILFSGCASQAPKIINSPSPLITLQINEDYRLLRSVYRIFSNKRLSDLVIKISQGGPSYIGHDIKEDVYYINSDVSRGVWIHELLHYFSYHLPNESIDYGSYDTLKEEFIIECAENLINGISSESFDKHFISKRK